MPKKTPSKFTTVILPLIGVALTIASGLWWYRTRPAQAKPPQSFTPAIDTASAPNPAPEGMVWIPGGSFWMGCDDERMSDAKPIHPVSLDGFWMDKSPVTNAQFAKFVEATHYVTVAEKPADPKQFPQAKPEQLVPSGVVFVAPSAPVPLEDVSWWHLVPGADWRHPSGPASDIKGRENHPVVQIAYEDAEAYRKWAGKRLPTEAEYEYAARGGMDRKPYSWGTDLKPNGKWVANIYEGHFPDHNTMEDGFAGSSPVDAFPPNKFGLHDMGGNVWQWCSDWYRPDTYATQAAAGLVTRNPTGPDSSADPEEPGIPKRVTRGGSFLCSEQYCVRFLVGSRGKAAVDTPLENLGFRCVKSK